MQKKSSRVTFLKHAGQSIFLQLKVKFKSCLGWLGVPKVIVYNGFVGANNVFINGCLTEDKGLAKPDHKNNLWQNILSMIKRYSSDQIPDAIMCLDIAHTHQKTMTNDNGIFSFNVAEESLIPQNKSQWIPCKVTFEKGEEVDKEEIVGFGEVLIPGTDSEYAIISDIDDTVLVSHSTKFLRKLSLMLLRNSRTRKHFPGVDAFYQALSKGVSGNNTNPFFYISSSEWALYDLLDDFFSFNKMPKGVFLLRELGVSIFKIWKSGTGKHEHKLEKIDLLFKSYPTLSFILIGDNGQQDTDIYTIIARRYPQRVKCIYIRTVKKVKTDRLKTIREELRRENISIIFTPTTIEAAQHAAAHHLITPQSLQDLQAHL